MSETESKGIFYLNGEQFCLAEMPEITFGSVNTQDDVRTISRSQSYSVTVKAIYPKMSRKKFIRSLVNRGYSKKDAKWLAWYCHDKKIPYGRADSLIAFGLSVR